MVCIDIDKLNSQNTNKESNLCKGMEISSLWCPPPPPSQTHNYRHHPPQVYLGALLCTRLASGESLDPKAPYRRREPATPGRQKRRARDPS